MSRDAQPTLPEEVEPDGVIEHHTPRQRRLHQRSRLGLNLTAMIDVTFLLLIYFMVATKFKVTEEVYRMDLPSGLQAQQERDPFELDEQPLRIEVATVDLMNTYRLRLDGPYQQPGTFEELYQFLFSRQIRDDAFGGMLLFEPDHPIVIAPTRTTRWEHAVEAFNAAVRARYTNVQFAPAP